MCGRYVLALPPAQIQQRFLAAGLQVDCTCADDSVRQSYNVAPGYQEPVYRVEPSSTETSTTPRYVIQPMKWGLVPSWRKTPSDYASTLKTINCRSDSLAQSSGLWHPIKQRKRCIIPAEGFYEWLHKPTGGKQPYYVKRADGELMFLAGLWDYCEEAGGYSYTIITTASNPQLSFLHDRMPVILDADAVKTWLDPARTSWSPELQNLLVPFEGELQVYPVSSEVGKVGNDSPSFVEPVSERKDGIKTFFERQKEVAITPKVENTDHPKENVVDEKSTGTTAPRPEKRKAEESPVEDTPTSPAKVLKTTRSAVSNAANRERNTKKSAPKTKPVTGGNQKITSFFGNKGS